VEVSRNGKRVVASYVSPHAYAPRTRAALVGLGYHVIAAATRGRFDDDHWKPDLRIVDDRHFDKLPAEDYLPQTPIIVLSGGRSRHWRDRRVVGEVSRPAGLGDLYPLLQEALEATPRRAARAPTQLPARCSRADQRWMGAITWLSSAGCLFRSASDITAEADFNLLFPLPRGRMVHTRARVKCRVGDEVGMEFHGAPERSQQAIADFVAERLAAARL
jgi:hypothetical protein